MKDNIYFEKVFEGPGKICHMCGKTFTKLVRLEEHDGKVFRYCEKCAKELGMFDPPYSYR